jgi:hypothetical protein
MVGKNESGKTAFLQGLARLRPVDGQPVKFDPVMDYPSKDYGPYRRRHDKGDADVVVQAEYELSDGELGSPRATDSPFPSGARRSAGRT